MRPLKHISLASLAAMSLCAAGEVRSETPLFASDTVLQLTLPVDFEEMCRPREDTDCGFTTTLLIWKDQDGASHSMPIEIKIRGGWRSLSRNCSVPLLWIQFREDEVAGTPFAGQSLLPLTTHCGKGLSVESLGRASNSRDYEQYLLREFVAHRIYNELTPYSVRSRLVRVSYPDPERPRGSSRHYAFFTEHFDALALRTDSERSPRGEFDYHALDAQAAAQLALFEYMVGNTDWSVVRERNIMLLREGDGRLIPVPYDLDMSGLVDADYAGPAPGLPIETVTERCYLGYCQPGIDWPALFDHFLDRREAILALPARIPGLSGRSQRWIMRFLGEFYDQLGSPETRDEYIVGSCQPWPPSPVDHTTPPGDGGR